MSLGLLTHECRDTYRSHAMCSLLQNILSARSCVRVVKSLVACLASQFGRSWCQLWQKRRKKGGKENNRVALF